MSPRGAPAWMVSFGDVMTLILTFFILLVSMADTQQVGLVASGVGSFLVETSSFGLPGVLDEHERAETFDHVRSRFNLPPEEDPERRADHLDASGLELIRAKTVEALAPHDQLSQPAVAVFEPGSAELTGSARRYLDLLSAVLDPAPGQTLLLEGHALDAGPGFRSDDTQLAFARAQAVRDYLVEVHSFAVPRVKVRAWLVELDARGPGTRSVDARLIIPDRRATR